MDGKDELREALRRRRADEESASQAQTQLDQKREAYEHDEETTRDRLHEAATAAVKAILRKGQPEPIEFGPTATGLSRLFGRDNHVGGWRVRLSHQHDFVLRPNGTLIPWSTTPPSASLQGIKLADWVDWQLREVRIDPNGEGVPIDVFSQAFQRDDLVGTGGNALNEERLRQRLNRTRDSVLSVLADMLRSAEVDV